MRKVDGFESQVLEGRCPVLSSEQCRFRPFRRFMRLLSRSWNRWHGSVLQKWFVVFFVGQFLAFLGWVEGESFVFFFLRCFLRSQKLRITVPRFVLPDLYSKIQLTHSIKVCWLNRGADCHAKLWEGNKNHIKELILLWRKWHHRKCQVLDFKREQQWRVWKPC